MSSFKVVPIRQLAAPRGAKPRAYKVVSGREVMGHIRKSGPYWILKMPGYEFAPTPGSVAAFMKLPSSLAKSFTSMKHVRDFLKAMPQ